ncbi:MAG: SDR family oxidoreductase [Bacteroidales bacterium]|nr:SDR family oxidoreductase [Bacteroidales bacterium]
MILVTGGTGFLGAHLIVKLLKSEDKINVLIRPKSKFELLKRVFVFNRLSFEELSKKITWIEGDLLDIYTLESALEEITKIYHAAAIVSFDSADHKHMMEVNVKGTANLVNAALEKNVKKICHVSSIAALGRADSNIVIDEKTVWKTSGKNSTYAISKYGAEREIWRAMEEGLKAVIVNPSIILGPGEINSGTAKLIKTIINGLKFYTEGINGFVDVRDVAEIMVKLMESDISGERFVVSASNVPYRDIFSIIAKYLEKPAPKYKASKWMGEMAWRMEYLKGKLNRTKPLITKETATTALNRYHYSNVKIKNLLDYSFIPVEDTLRDACNFYMGNSF